MHSLWKVGAMTFLDCYPGRPQITTPRTRQVLAAARWMASRAFRTALCHLAAAQGCRFNNLSVTILAICRAAGCSRVVSHLCSPTAAIRDA